MLCCGASLELVDWKNGCCKLGVIKILRLYLMTLNVVNLIFKIIYLCRQSTKKVLINSHSPIIKSENRITKYLYIQDARNKIQLTGIPG